MEDRDQLAFYSKAFLLRNAFSKSIYDFKSEEAAIMSVKDKEDVFLAVKKAYLDSSPRTNKKTEKEQNVDKWKSEKARLFKALAEKISDTFGNYDKNQNKMTKELFDEIHKKLCDLYLNEYNIISEDYGGYFPIKYGKTQKVINMTFKYLFCFDDAQDYVDIFNCCHMALDSYILKWYYNEVAKKYEKKDIVRDIKSSNGTKKTERYAWSNIKSFDEYMKIQNQIKGYLEKDTTRSDLEKLPFFAEFRIWEEQLKKEQEK